MSQRSRQATTNGRRQNPAQPPRAANMRLSVEHFGPIRSGDVEVKPLTVLIGANNSGKTYLAQLIYLLSKTLSARVLEFNPAIQSMLISPILLSGFGDEFAELTSEELDEQMREQLHVDIDEFVVELERSLHYSLGEYFGVESVAALSQSAGERGPLRIVLHGLTGQPALVEIKGQANQTPIAIARPDLQPVQLPTVAGRSFTPEMSDRLARRFVAEQSWFRVARDYGVHDGGEFYMPAARSGILAAWPLITSLAIGAVRRRLGFERIDVGTLSGVTGEFLQQFIANFAEPRALERERNPLESALEILEGTILGGNVSVEDQGGGGAALLYRGQDVDLPLQRSSSMVVELASLDLWLNHLVRPGDLLVIDEPEAHLHPANQRRMARVLVRLINAGVRVVCATHSSLLVHQLSNHILATEASSEGREALGFTGDDRLDSRDVAVYLFDVGDKGTDIRPVPIIDGFGISEEEFAMVAEQIGDETYHLLTSTGTAR